jgi:hypothetical protein
MPLPFVMDLKFAESAFSIFLKKFKSMHSSVRLRSEFAGDQPCGRQVL